VDSEVVIGGGNSGGSGSVVPPHARASASQAPAHPTYCCYCCCCAVWLLCYVAALAAVSAVVEVVEVVVLVWPYMKHNVVYPLVKISIFKKRWKKTYLGLAFHVSSLHSSRCGWGGCGGAGVAVHVA
jgi:hypothetical protein